MKLPLLRGLSQARQSASLREPSPSFHEYELDGPRYHQGSNTQLNRSERRLFIVLERESRTIFSAIRILFYFKQSPPSHVDPETWDFQLLGSVAHTSRGQLPSPNSSSLPVLTIAFELQRELGWDDDPTSFLAMRSLSPEAITKLSRSDILFEYESCLNRDVSSLQLSLMHTVTLETSYTYPLFLEPSDLRHCPQAFGPAFLTTRVIRVVPPSAIAAASRTTGDFFPDEIFLQIFEDRTFSQEDLLSFARVCYAWGRCAMEVLRAHWNSGVLVHPPLLSFTLETAPVLGLGIKSLRLIDLMRISSPVREVTSWIVRILMKTKNLEFLQLGPFDRSRLNAVVAALGGLRNLHTLILGRPINREVLGEDASHIPNIIDLSRFLLVLPSLRSLEVHDLQPGVLGVRKLILSIRPPRCPLTHLTLTRSNVSDSDLMHLFSFSAKTLEVVILDTLEGITNAGLLTFLHAISQTVSYLAIRDVGVPPESEREIRLSRGKEKATERALDVAVESMPHLGELCISGNVATGLMLERRSKAFLRSCGESGKGLTPIPVVQLVWVGNCTGSVDRAGWSFINSRDA